MNKEKLWGWIIGIIILAGFGLSIYFYGFWAFVKALLLSILIGGGIGAIFSSMISKPGMDTPIYLNKIRPIMEYLGIILGIIGFIISYILILN